MSDDPRDARDTTPMAPPEVGATAPRPSTPAPAGPGRLRRVAGWIWWLVDGSRRLVLNLLFLLVVGAVLFAWLRAGTPPLNDKTVLVLNLRGPLVDQRAGDPRDRAIKQMQGAPDAQVQLRDVVRALNAAATDPAIASVLLVLDDFAGAGLPNLREVTQALQHFRQASGGKKVIAWGSNYSQRQYYLAAHADEVLLHPMGMVMLEGYGSLRNYYRDALDRLGVQANVIRVGKFKNAGEPFFANAPSPATLEADAALFGSLWRSYTRGVEAARKLPEGSIDQGIAQVAERLQQADGSTAQLALQSKLVDGLKTRDELRAMMLARGAMDPQSKTFRQITLDGYLSRLDTPARHGPAVAVVVAEGGISDGDAPPGAVGGRSTAELVRQAREDEQVRAIVLRVRSPGGSAFGSELVRRELELTRKAGKPVVVSMGDVAASGGYWISLAADEMIADPATITGSIGVFAMLPTADGLMAKLPVHASGVATAWLANAYDPRKPMDPRFAALVQTGVNRIYTDFTTLAAQARRSTPQKIDEVAQGRVWTGEQALERGLVDRLGGLREAMDSAAKRAKLEPGWRVVYMEREPGRLARLLGLMGTQVGQWALPWLQAARNDALATTLLGAPEWTDMADDLAWLTATRHQRRPFDAVVHCLCTPP